MTVTHVTAIITPRPGKEARVQELIETAVRGTEAEEKDGCHKYILTKAVESNEFIVIETYASMEAFQQHKSKTYFTDFAAALEKEDLVSKPPSIIPSEKISGFDSR